jgi:phosphoglycerate kinase
LGDVYVNDAFGAAHRAHASTAAVTEYTSEAVSGFLMEREIRYLDETISHPQRPFVAVLGGAKVSGKIEVIDHLLAKVDALIIGGGMAYTFFKAMGLEIGDSLLEEDLVEVAQRVMQQAERVGVELLLPSDSVVADRFAADAQIEIVTRDAFAPGWMGLDIGPQTCKTFADKLGAARTIVWNGPMGVFELAPFAAGTRALGEAIARSTEQGAISVVGGGDTASALAQAGLSEKMTHISTGGGASLEAMAGRELPGVAVLAEK